MGESQTKSLQLSHGLIIIILQVLMMFMPKLSQLMMFTLTHSQKWRLDSFSLTLVLAHDRNVLWEAQASQHSNKKQC